MNSSTLGLRLYNLGDILKEPKYQEKGLCRLRLAYGFGRLCLDITDLHFLAASPPGDSHGIFTLNCDDRDSEHGFEFQTGMALIKLRKVPPVAPPGYHLSTQVT